MTRVTKSHVGRADRGELHPSTVAQRPTLSLTFANHTALRALLLAGVLAFVTTPVPAAIMQNVSYHDKIARAYRAEDGG